MASQEIATNTDFMQTDIDSLTTQLEAARTQLDRMFNEILELDTMWDGPANDEFNRQFGIDKVDCEELLDTIDSIIECMIYAKTEYEKCENEVGGIIDSISV